MTMYRWILTTAMAFSSVALACDSGNGDDGSDASGNDDETSDGDDEDGEESGEDSSSTSSSSSTTTSSTTSDDDGQDSGDSVYATQIQPIWDENCMGSLCHAGVFPPNLSEGQSYDAIVGVDALTSEPYIAPNDVDGSYLYRKLTGVDITGDRMPSQAPPLGDADMAIIEAWIEAGAPE